MKLILKQIIFLFYNVLHFLLDVEIFTIDTHIMHPLPVEFIIIFIVDENV